jgi:hypothetical protein
MISCGVNQVFGHLAVEGDLYIFERKIMYNVIHLI